MKTAQRYHDYDFLRAVALFLGLPFHAGLAYVDVNHWIVQDASQSSGLLMILGISRLFRMPLFFLMAGFFVALVLNKNQAGFLLKRTKRLLIPLLVFFLILVCPIKVLWLTGEYWTIGAPSADWLTHVKLNFLSSGDSIDRPPANWAHLWFLLYLYLYSVIALGLHKMRQGFLFVPIAWLIGLWLMNSNLIDDPFTLYPKPALFFYYGSFFFTGLFAHNYLATARWKTPRVIFSSVGGLLLAIGGLSFHTTDKSYVILGVLALATLLILDGILGAARLYCRQASRRVAELVEASYFIYLYHLPLIALLQLGLWFTPFAWWIKWPLITGVSFLLCLEVYRRWVRGSSLERFLNGNYQLPYER